MKKIYIFCPTVVLILLLAIRVILRMSGIYANYIGRTIAYMLLIAAPVYYAIICAKPHKHRLTVCAMQIVFDAIIVFPSEFADLLTGHIDKSFVLNLLPVYVIVPLVIMTVLTLIIGIVRDLVVQIDKR